MKELFHISTEFPIELYHDIKFNIGNVLEHESYMSLFSNLELDYNDAGIIYEKCFLLKDVDVIIFMDDGNIEVRVDFECNNIEVSDLLVKNWEDIQLNIETTKEPHLHLYWNKYHEHEDQISE